MRTRLMIFAALVAACIAPATAQRLAEEPVPREMPELPAGVPVPPRGQAACFDGEPPVCIINAPDFMHSERMARLAVAHIQALQAELAKLKESCVAKLTIPNDGTKKRS